MVVAKCQSGAVHGCKWHPIGTQSLQDLFSVGVGSTASRMLAKIEKPKKEKPRPRGESQGFFGFLCGGTGDAEGESPITQLLLTLGCETLFDA